VQTTKTPSSPRGHQVKNVSFLVKLCALGDLVVKPFSFPFPFSFAYSISRQMTACASRNDLPNKPILSLSL
jgi:hypothetical protein